jgi:RND family efflux transporter MFP subunit
VQVIAVQAEKRPATEEVVGTVRPKLSSMIAAKVNGTVEKIMAYPGQSVKAGELIAQISAREIQARMEQAVAVRDQAKKEMDRFTKLLSEKAITQAEFDGAQARLRVAEGAVVEADTLLSYTKITTPFEGVITRKLVDVGDLATAGRPLFEIEDSRALRFEADIPEAAIDQIKLGNILNVQASTLREPIQAPIVEISPAADPNSRTFLVKMDLPPSTSLRSGQFGRVEVPLAEIEVLRIPAKALVVRGQMEIVFVVKERKAELRLVKSGKASGGKVELVSGLNAGETIVVEGASQLQDGQPLQF